MTSASSAARRRRARSQNPALQFDLRTRPGDANIKSLAVTLPKAFAIDQRHLGNICSKAQLAAEHCAGRQPIGTADDDNAAARPAADRPGLRGLRLRQAAARRLHPRRPGDDHAAKPNPPRSNGRLKTTVPVVPDAPIGHFRLTLFGGKKGYLVNTRNLCGSPAVTKIVLHRPERPETVTRRVPTKTACRNEKGARRDPHRGSRR